MKYNLYLSFLFFTTVGFLSSCVNQKEFIYFQNQPHSDPQNAGEIGKYATVLYPDDLLTIHVSAMDPDVVKPFNIPVSSSQPGAYTPATYLIDNEGMIEFPVLGNVKLGGLTTRDATQLLKERLKLYINNPIVHIRIVNFKITVLGDVRNPGVYTIQNERITLPEALGLAGDLNITGVRNNVLVVRELNGRKTEIRADLRSNDVFHSPAYYLRQNDVIYIEPNKSKIASTNRSAIYGTYIITGASLIINIINILTR